MQRSDSALGQGQEPVLRLALGPVLARGMEMEFGLRLRQTGSLASI